MKKLEELGISPAPWRVCDELTLSGDVVGVECADEKADLVAGDIVITRPNALLIAAAPKLYDALCESVESRCLACYNHRKGLSCVKVGGCCPVHKWRAALAEAAGESEVRHE